MIKLIAIDMDGTLLNSKKQLLEETKQYFKNFHHKDTETRYRNVISPMYR